VNIHSPYRHRSPALSTGGSSKSSSSSASGSEGNRGSWEVETSDASSSEVEVVTLVAPPHILGAPTLKRGGRRSVSPKGRVPMKTKVSTYTLAKFDSDSSMDTDGGSEKEGRGGYAVGRSTTRMKSSISSVFDEFDQEEKDIVKGIFPGNFDQSLTSRFVAYHFAGIREDYYPFSRWAEAQALTNPASPILIATWKAQNFLRRGRAKRGEDESTADDDGDFGELYSKEGNKTDDEDYGVADSKVCNKTRMKDSANSPLSQAPQTPKCLFQREEHVTSLTGVSSKKVGQRDTRELFPLAQGPARGQASSPLMRGMSRESGDQLGKLKDDASYGPVRRVKEITWSGSTNSRLAESIDTSRADSLEIDFDHGPTSFNRGARHSKVSTAKMSKMKDQLNNQEKKAAAAIAMVNTLRTRQEEHLSGGMRQEEDLSGGILLQDSVSKRSEAVPLPTPSPQAAHAPLVTSVGNLLSEMAVLRQHTPGKGTSVPLSEVTPSISTADSFSALSSSVSTPAKLPTTGRSSLNSTSYPGVPHGNLPGNEVAVENGDGDLFSLSHRIIPGSAGSFWFLQVSFEILPDQDSRSTLLLGLASLLEILSSVIDGFEMHPLNPESTLPFLTSGLQAPKTAILAFKYCGVKNKRIVRNSSQSLAKPPQKNLQRHNDDEEFTPSTSVQAVIRVRGRENVKTACDSISWDMSESGLSIRWKEHQSADSSAQILLMCCPPVFDKRGLEEEIVYHLKTMEKDLIRKGALPSTLSIEPLPQIAVSWRQNKQGRGRSQAEQRLCLNNLEAFQRNGCMVCTVEAEEGTWGRLGPLWQRLHKTGIVRRALGRRVLMVVMYNGRVTDGDRCTLQRLRRCNVVYNDKLDSVVIPNIVTVHKRVEVRMEDTGIRAPHKFTSLNREFMMLSDPILSAKGEVVYAFDAIIPIIVGPNSGGATLTFRRDNAYANALVRKIKTNVAAWFFGFWRQKQGYRLEMVQSLMESFSIEASHLAQFSTFDPITMTVDAEFGDADGQLEGVELELGIDRDWEADMEGNDGRTIDVVGHKEALETTLRDRIADIDDADRSGPSRRTDFSQSTGNSTNNTDATTRMHTHRERALTTIALVNKNSTLTSNLEDTEEHLQAMIAQNLALQRQLASLPNVRPDQDQDNDTTMEEEGPAVLRGGGGQGFGSDAERSESPKGYRDLYRVGEFRNIGAYESIGGTANGSGPRGQYTGLTRGSVISPGNFIRAQHHLAEQGHRPSSGSSITRLHDSATNTQQDVDKASDGGSEEPSL